MFEEREWMQIVERLVRLTKEQVLTWKTVAAEGTEWVETRVDDLDYMVGSVDNDQRPPYYLSLWDVNSRDYLARLESEPIQEDDEWGQAPLTAGNRLLELRTVAYRSAQGSPQLLSRIMNGFDRIDPEVTPF